MFVTNVLSSHYPGSFAQALLEGFETGLKEAGHGYKSFDLYAENFNPVMQGEDFNQFFNKPITAEIAAIQEVVGKSDAMAFFYPVWWNDMPAIMKGFVDRVFSKGFAYDYDKEKQWGLLELKKVLLVCTFGNRKTPAMDALEEAMRIKENQGVFGYCGVKEVDHVFLYNPEGNETTKQDTVERMRQMGRNL